jgi:hypothetical protein
MGASNVSLDRNGLNAYDVRLADTAPSTRNSEPLTKLTRDLAVQSSLSPVAAGTFTNIGHNE